MAKEIQLDRIVHVVPKEEYELPEPELAIAPKETHKFCHHDHILIYEHYRLIKCKDCGATLDAFDFLIQKARKESSDFSTLRWLGYEVKRQNEHIENLKKEISNLKQQKKRLL